MLDIIYYAQLLSQKMLAYYDLYCTILYSPYGIDCKLYLYYIIINKSGLLIFIVFFALLAYLFFLS